MGKNVANVWNKSLKLKPERGSWSRAQGSVHDDIDRFFAYYVSNLLIYTVEQLGRAVRAAAFAETEGANKKALLRAHLCRRGLALCLLHE